MVSTAGLVLLCLALSPSALAALRYHHRGPALFTATLRADSWFTRVVHREDYELAIDHAKQCLADNPDSAGCHRLLGIALARMGERDAALREYRAYLKLSHDESSDVELVMARETYRFMD